MRKLALHFGAGNIGRGFIAPVLQQNDFEVVFVDVNKELVSSINENREYQVSTIGNENSIKHIKDVGAVDIEDKTNLQKLVEQSSLISTSVGPKFVPEIAATINEYSLFDSVIFMAFENQYRASTSAFKDLKNKVIPIDAVVDKIIPPQSTDSLDVLVEDFGSIFIEENEYRPLTESEVVSYGDYENEFIKKLWLLNGLHLKLSYFGLSKELKYIHELFESDEYSIFATKAVNSLKEAFTIHTGYQLDLDEYCKNILTRFSMPEVKDELIRVARNPLIKFSHSERFEFPLRVLISNNKSIDTFKEVFQIILEKDFHQIEGYEEFNYNFKNGIQEFFTKFWQVPQEKTTTYIERLV